MGEEHTPPPVSILFFFPPLLKPRCQFRVMGFVGCGGNIATTTALPPSFCVLYWMCFWMWRLALVSGVLFLLSAEYTVVMCGTWPGTLVTWPRHRLVMTYCCALRLWSQICITCGVAGSRIWSPCLVVPGRMPRARGMAAYVRDGYRAFHQPNFKCGCCKILFFRDCGVRQNLHVLSLYRNPDLDDQIFDCLLTSMAARVVGFYNHKSSWCCSLWLCNCVWLRSVGCRNDPCTWCNAWPPYWYSWRIGRCCSTQRYLRSLLPVGSHFDGTGCTKHVSGEKFSLNIKSIGIQLVVQYRVCPVVAVGLLTILLRFWTNICCCWLDVMFQTRQLCVQQG